MATMRRPIHPNAPEGSERWVCIYPAYINKDKTRAEGRRINRDKAVGAPTCKELLDVLNTTGLQVYPEGKLYPREKSREAPFWGRVKVQIKNSEGAIINQKFGNREDIYLFCAERIPKLQSRTNPKPVQESQSQGKQGKGKKKK
ncbi:signal recognition particle 19 [Oratosquilla oratoria]|uniref:signal recognition particle 19 n=1 Tax=Oratosquilla oratoria TaxID=337810 RepID=UPI003F768699